MNLAEYIEAYAQRGACTCGRCADAPENPEQKQPAGHTADVIFFKVSARDGASADQLKNLIREQKGDFNECDPFDGKEHSYIEIGGWIGDQGLALCLIGLGSCLGLWKLLTPYTVLGKDVPEKLAKDMAGAGLVCLQSEKP